MKLGGMPIDPWLPRAAAQHPDRVALEAPEGELTYAQLLEAARIDAAPGTRVAIALPPGLDFAVALHACRAAAGRAELRQRPGQRPRLGRGARAGPRRALAVPAAALARRRADGAAALRDLRDPRGHRRRRARLHRRHHGRLARADAAAAAA